MKGLGLRARLLGLLIAVLLGFAGAAPLQARPDVQVGEVIALQKLGGVYHVPVELNGFLELMFILDTGAAEMSIPSNVVQSLMRAGTVDENDYLSGKIFVLANGRRVESPRIMLRKVKIGHRVLHNVPATVSEAHSPLLLGQSLLEKMGSYTFDPQSQLLVLHGNPQDDMGERVPVAAHEEVQPYESEPVNKNEVESVVERFFLSVSRQEYDVSWHTLSTYSQNTIVAMVAKEADMAPEVIRELFEENHRSVQMGFWTSFRDTSLISQLTPHAVFRQTSQAFGQATVTVWVGSDQLRFDLYEEDGKWRLGLIESLERAKKLPKD